MTALTDLIEGVLEKHASRHPTLRESSAGCLCGERWESRTAFSSQCAHLAAEIEKALDVTKEADAGDDLFGRAPFVLYTIGGLND